MPQVKTNSRKTARDFFNGTLEEILVYIVSETDSDADALHVAERYQLLTYCSYIEHMDNLVLKPMPFEQWIDSDPDDVRYYRDEQERKADLLGSIFDPFIP